MPVDQVAPWTGPRGPSLGWHALTLGWYHLRLREAEIFRCLDPQPGQPPYDDYQVAWLWESLLETLPQLLAPIGAPVSQRSGVQWRELFVAVDADAGRVAHQDMPADLQALRSFCISRTLDTWYLTHPPRVHFLRNGEDTMAVTWTQGPPYWQPSTGVLELPVAEFLAEVRSFTDRLLAAMAPRIEPALERCQRERIGIVRLREEQVERAT
jgi:hypothetical protein